MSKEDYEGLLKITNKARWGLVILMNGFEKKGHQQKYPQVYNSMVQTIAELDRYEFALRAMLRGNSRSEDGEAIKFLLEEIETVADGETRTAYLKKLRKIIDRVMTDDPMEASNAEQG